MAAKRAQDLVREWREREGVSQAQLGAKIGDVSGQLQRWESGNRPTLPLRMKARLALETGIPLARIVDADELETARELVAALVRDAAA